MSSESGNSSLIGKIAVLIAILMVAATVTWNRANARLRMLLLFPTQPSICHWPRNQRHARGSGGRRVLLGNPDADVFQHVKGVKAATSGYSGGSVANPEYEQVSTGETGHAESVKITFDPAQVSYGQLLKVFFSVAHDPTELNRQGPDSGTQYRSVIFYANEEQKHIAESYIAQLEKAKSFPRPIVTQVVPLKAFYKAEAYHQDYATLHPDNPYIAINDAPKVDHLREQFPDLYKK